MALKKGICKNYGNCTLADNEEIQEVDSSEFKCTECGKDLHEVTDEPGFHVSKRLIYIIVAAIILIGGGIGAYFGFFKSSGTPEPDPVVSLSLNKDALTLDVGTCETLKATISTTPYSPDVNISVAFMSDNANVAQVDNTGVVRAVAKGETTITVVAYSPKGTADTAKVRVTVNEKLPRLTPKPLVKNTKTYSFGKYVGSLKNGIPEGDGKMYYSRHIQIAKHDTDNPPHYAESGDWFVGTWGNGDIISGALYSKDGKIKEKIFAPKRYNPHDLTKD